PSGKLPIELLSEIFLLCVEDSMDDDNTIRIPLELSKICARWRSAAISNPHLWSKLSVQLEGQSSNRHPELVDTWLRRSAACPLTFYLFWENPPFDNTHPILEKILEHSERWRTMFFYLPYRAFASFQRIRGRLPMLMNLSLGTADDGPLPPHSRQASLDMFELAPRLRSLECVNISPTMFKFPWAQLQDIPLLSGNIVECLDVLDRSKRLSKLSYIFVEGGPPAPHTILATPVLPTAPGLPTPYPHIYHNQLTSLSIMTPPYNEFVDLSPLFPHIHLPNLESLTICNLNSPFGNEFIQFLSNLHALRTLHLRKTSLPDDQLVEGLKHLPSLTSLIVLTSSHTPRGGVGGGVATEQTVTRYLLEALTRNFFSEDAMEGMLLPRLKKLELTVSSAAARELDTFIDMLQSRLRSDEPESFVEFGGSSPMSSPSSEMSLARLEHVRVRPNINLDDEFLIRLVELRDLGLEVEVEKIQE
ncbi:hypothetical protein CPB83DRAFT_739224, partial [Crepidotus variabilis]